MAITDASRLANFASNVGTGVTFAGNDILVAGVVTATSFVGDGSNITNAGSSLDASSGSQRLVVTSLTTGTMTSAGTDADLTWNSSTKTLSTGIVSTTTLSGNVTGTSATFTGNVTGTTADFSGNVTIGGTLTYEDVTNVDSVGIITAQSGIRVGASQSISAVSGTLTYYGDGSNLTGIQAGFANFVASGAIANGAPVIVNGDGTVTGVATVSTGTTAGTATEYLGVSVSNNVVVYDTAQDKIVIFSKISGKSQAVVGTVSGTSITFGTPVDAYGSTPSYHDACYDVNSGKIVYCYRADGDSDVGRVLIGTVSGTSISFGSEVTYDSDLNGWPRIAYDANAQKFVIAWTQGSGYAGKAIVGTVAGTSATFGSAASFTTKPYGKDIVYDASAQKVVIYYKDNNDSNKGKAIVGTVSGTSISFGSAAEFESGQVGTSNFAASYDSVNQKTVIAYIDEDDSSYGKANVGTISGTSISFGTPQTFNTASTNHLASAYDATAAKTIIAYNSASDGFLRESTLDGTTIEYESAYMWTSNSQEYPDMEYDPDQGVVVIGYTNPQDSNNGYAQVVKPGSVQTNMTTDNYIGIAGEAISNGATGKINIVGGVNSSQSGLTTAKTYYVGQTGILTTTADTPSVVTGTSISDTKIIVWRS